MTLEQVKQQITKIADSVDGCQRVVILNCCQDNKIRDFIETLPGARQVSAAFQFIITGELEKNGKSDDGVE